MTSKANLHETIKPYDVENICLCITFSLQYAAHCQSQTIPNKNSNGVPHLVLDIHNASIDKQKKLQKRLRQLIPILTKEPNIQESNCYHNRWPLNVRLLNLTGLTSR